MRRTWFAKIKKYRRLLLLLLFLLALIGLAALDPVHERIAQVLEWAKPIMQEHGAWGMALFVLLAALSAILFFFSAAVILPVAIHTWGAPTTIALLWVSWMLGGLATYFIGRHPGRKLAKWLITERKVSHYGRKFSAKAPFSLVLLFQLSVPSEIPGYVLGSLRYPLHKYLMALGLTEIPLAVGAVYLGDSFLGREYLPLLLIGLAAVLLSALAFYFLQKRMAD